MLLTSSYRGHITSKNLIPKCKILNVFWIVRKTRIEQFIFLNWLSNVKSLVLSNGFERVRNRIQWHLK